MSTNTDQTPEKTEDNRVVIFDTTMRDGEQSPGASMSLDEKLRIAELLERMGVDIIEAGFPIASNGDFAAVNEISKLVRGSIISENRPRWLANPSISSKSSLAFCT